MPVVIPNHRPLVIGRNDNKMMTIRYSFTIFNEIRNESHDVQYTDQPWSIVSKVMTSLESMGYTILDFEQRY